MKPARDVTEMRLVVAGSQGNIGRRLRRAFPDAVGIDRREGADIVADLGTVDFESGPVAAALSSADALIHLATSADPEAPEAVHFRAISDTARLVAAAARFNISVLVLASSDWAEPNDGLAINAYGHAKRAIEEMAAMYMLEPGRRAVALRIGWVPGSKADLESAEDWLKANYWNDQRLVGAFEEALGISPHD